MGCAISRVAFAIRLLRTYSLALSGVTALSACSDTDYLPDTLYFPPGLDVEYHGVKAKLYGTSQCAQGGLTGHSCLIFPPHAPKAVATLVTPDGVESIDVIARVSLDNPVVYEIWDSRGYKLLETTGRHDDQANISLIGG